MRGIWLLFLSVTAFMPFAKTAPPDAALSRAVVRLSMQLSGEAADPNPVAYAVSATQTVVLFILHDSSGGNGTAQVIAFFTSRRSIGHVGAVHSHYQLLAYREIGSEGSRLFQLGSGVVRHGHIELRGATHLARDPLCCPSQALKSSFTVKNGQVVEQSLAPN